MNSHKPPEEICIQIIDKALTSYLHIFVESFYHNNKGLTSWRNFNRPAVITRRRASSATNLAGRDCGGTKGIKERITKQSGRQISRKWEKIRVNSYSVGFEE